ADSSGHIAECLIATCVRPTRSLSSNRARRSNCGKCSSPQAAAAGDWRRDPPWVARGLGEAFRDASRWSGYNAHSWSNNAPTENSVERLELPGNKPDWAMGAAGIEPAT